MRKYEGRQALKINCDTHCPAWACHVENAAMEMKNMTGGLKMEGEWRDFGNENALQMNSWVINVPSSIPRWIYVCSITGRWGWNAEMGWRDGEVEEEKEHGLLSVCWWVSHAEPIAGKPSVEISKEVITTGPAQFLTVDARLPMYSWIDLNEEAMNILE